MSSPLSYHPDLNDAQKKFLGYFPNTVYAYIPDHDTDRPIIHSEVLNLENQKTGYGIFFSVNGFSGGRRISENLTNFNAFFCDIDYPDKVNKTAQKIKDYKQDMLMELIANELPIPTYITETKNGLHVFWILEKPIYLSELNPEQQENIRIKYREIEESILKHFDGDPGAKDVARVLRVPGTLHQKDKDAPFEVKIWHYTEECVYSFSEIAAAFLKKPAPSEWAVARGENAINEEAVALIEQSYPRLSRPSYTRLFSKETGSVPEGMRNKALLVAAYAAKESGWPIEQTFAHFGSDFHGLSLREIRKTIASAYEHKYDFGYNNEVMQAMVTPEERVQLSQTTSKVLSKTTREVRDTSNNAQKEKYSTYEYVIADRYENLKFKQRGDFYDYSAGMYKALQVDEVRSIYLSEMLKDGLTNYRKVSSVNDKIACFKSLDGKTFRHEDENPDDSILNFKNGLLDIRDYQLREHTPAYLSTSQIPIMFNHEAKCTRWRRFVAEVTNDDPDQQKLLQEIAGYSLTTDTRYAKAFIFFGSGANGKSMFARMLGKIVGRDNVSSLNLTTITKQFGLTGLIGKKVNFIDEISGHYFESNIIKGIISGEQVAAEIKFRPEPIEFIPTVKLIFSVNELPKINDTTPGLYRRFIIVPFDRSFEKNPDLTLEETLTAELPGILNWAIEGLKILREEGKFNETERNFEAMRMFKVDNSPLVEFINLFYQPVPESEHMKYEISVGVLYKEYRNYCFDHGYKPKALANFVREVSHNRVDGFDLKKLPGAGGGVIRGIRKNLNFAQEEIVYPDQMKTYGTGY